MKSIDKYGLICCLYMGKYGKFAIDITIRLW